jgi:hypothetical protein
MTFILPYTEGLITEEGISLSDSYILNLEGKKYSETVNKCREYIYRNILNDITHEDVANFVVLSSS